ncbi:hypothetical protein DFJ43DRAFT_1005486 [Lentinula guzmanii]|uniref:Uncharacterized protein n=1 Tax=Lentinula guzmanii TaxID=2804957 RepID=A0AA38MVZ4_9AGAR|nr:hypothetical protein DFJ43DRAFT_1005486 [Lentinula guzmanii]
MDTLPTEILTVILAIVLQDTKSTNILCTSSLFRSIAQRILHQDLCFFSSSQLTKFAHVLSTGVLSLACEPQSLMLDIAGGASFKIFEGLHAVLTQIVSDPQCKRDENGRLILETLRLRLNSLTHDDHRLIYTSLSKVNARHFIWTGPDPPHHFSTAIVSPAVFPLFKALAAYTRLTHLHLTNIAFPSSVINPDACWTGIPCLPSLHFLYLGQATFLTAEHITEFVLRSHSGYVLECIRLVDVYEESIWGPRLKLPHILLASATLLAESGFSKLSSSTASDLIERLVRVDAKTERITGGDRAMPEVPST